MTTTTNDGAWVYYKLTCEPSAQVSKKKKKKKKKKKPDFRKKIVQFFAKLENFTF